MMVEMVGRISANSVRKTFDGRINVDILLSDGARTGECDILLAGATPTWVRGRRLQQRQASQGGGGDNRHRLRTPRQIIAATSVTADSLLLAVEWESEAAAMAAAHRR